MSSERQSDPRINYHEVMRGGGRGEGGGRGRGRGGMVRWEKGGRSWPLIPDSAPRREKRREKDGV